jgi:hypothetical protein
MNMSAILRGLPALAVAAFIAWTTGCGIETQVTGITADADISRPDLMHVLAHGANLELSHLHLINYSHFTAAATDEVTNGYNSSGSYRRRAVNQYQQRPDWVYSQTNESGWVAAYAAERMMDVNEDNGTDPGTDPLIAHMRINSALAMQWLAEGQCVACVNWGPDGGELLKGSGDIYDPGNVVDSDSIMQTAITWAEMAETVAQAAAAAGRTNEYEPTWEHFIPENSLNAAYAIQAMGYLWLEDYAKADEFAAKVPIDFVWNLYSHEDNSWRNRWVYYTNQWALTTVWGSAVGTTFRDVQDPRIPWSVCGEYKDGLTVGGRRRSSSEYDRFLENPGCKSYSYSGRYRTYDGDLPNYAQLKYTSWDDELVLLSGQEMKLVRAEVALRAGNLGAMTGFINDVRAFHGLDPIDVPATAGALEYPNAEDDAWSILDRESLFTLWLDGRRYANFRRWQHPFWTGGHYKTPDEALDNAGQPRPKYMRADGSLDYCMPLPSSEECNINPLVRDTQWCAKLYAPGDGG